MTVFYQWIDWPRKLPPLPGETQINLIDITDLSSDDLARLADSPLAEAFSNADSARNLLEAIVCQAGRGISGAALVYGEAMTLEWELRRV